MNSIMKNFRKGFIFVFILITVFLSMSHFVQSQGLVSCDECGFSDILTLINKVTTFIFENLVIPIAAIAFAYAGFELLTSGGETSKKEKAKKIFTDVAIGLIIAAAAFLIVQTILSVLGYDQSWNWFGFEKNV